MGRTSYQPDSVDVIDFEFAARIRREFKGSLMRAFEELELALGNLPDDDPDNVAMSLSTFYRIMRGEQMHEKYVHAVFLAWIRYVDRREIELMKKPPLDAARHLHGTLDDLHEFIRAEFGTLFEAQKILFPDIPYPTFAGLLKGRGDQRRIEEIRARLEKHMKREATGDASTPTIPG